MTANISLKTSDFYAPVLSNISDLPSDTLINVFEYLNSQSAIQFGRASHALYQVQENANLWKFFCIRDFFSGSSSVKEALPLGYRTWKIYYQQFESVLLVPFPGKAASFKVVPSKDWRVQYIGASLIRELSFKSEIKKSFFKNFSLLGHEGGDIFLSLKVAKDVCKTVETYFKALSLEDEEPFFVVRGNFLFKNPNDIRKIFKIIKTFNQIDENSLSLTERLAFSIKWELITPLTMEETQKLVADKQKYSRSDILNTWYGWLIQKLIMEPLFRNFPY